MNLSPSLHISLILIVLSACSNPSDITLQEPAVAAAAVAVPVAERSKPSDESLVIAFSDGGAALSVQANEQLDGAARLYQDAKPEVMIVAGHSDRVGGEYENLLLSARRAALVKRALVDRGVPAERLQIVAIGEAQPVASVTPSRVAVVTWR